MTFEDALALARKRAARRREDVAVVLQDAVWHEYDVATEYDLETYHAGSRVLAWALPDGRTEVCH